MINTSKRATPSCKYFCRVCGLYVVMEEKKFPVATGIVFPPAILQNTGGGVID